MVNVHFSNVPQQKEERTIRAHWNWYKNHKHFMYCFYNRKKEVVLDIVKRCRKAKVRSRVNPMQLLASPHVQKRLPKVNENERLTAEQMLKQQQQMLMALEQDDTQPEKMKPFRIFPPEAYPKSYNRY